MAVRPNPPVSRSRKALLVAAAVCALLGFGAAAQAQPVAPKAEQSSASTSLSSVTVQGVLNPKMIQRQASSFVELYAAATPKRGQIGRWREPICVQVVNLTPEQAAMVQARVEAVARDVGLLIRKPGCHSNVQIVLTSQPQAFVDKVAKSDEHALGFHYRSDLSKVKTVTRPIQAWYKTASQTSRVADAGMAFATLSAGSDPVINTGSWFGELSVPESIDIDENGSPPGCAGSLINDCLRTVFKNVLVVVDSRAVAGKDLGAVADYLTMLALSQPNSQDGCGDLPSIFDLLAKSLCAGRDPPDGLTAADAAMLTALYASDPETKAASERVDVAGRMAEMLIKANTAASPPRTDPRQEGKK